MNTTNTIGRIGQDIELRYTPAGTAVTDLNFGIPSGSGDNKKTIWVKVTLWDKSAELVHRYCRKGDRLGVFGRLDQDDWEKDGKVMKSLKIVASSITLIEPRRETNEPPSIHDPGMF